MRKQRKIALLSAAMLIMSAFCACGKQQTELDTAAVADTLLEQVEFASALEKASDTTAMLMYDLPEGTDIELYIGDGSYSDELAIITCSDKSEVTNATQAVKQHLDDLKASFEDYIPEEADKIDDAVTKTVGNHIIVCVSGDENADCLIDEAVK